MKKSKYSIFGILGIIVLLVAVSGCTSNTNYTNGTNNATPASSSDSNLVILNSKMTAGSYGEYDVTGQAMNNGSESMSYASVNAKFYDKSGNVLNSGLDNINDLGPGEKWNFKIMYMGDSAPSSYKIAVGSTM